MIISFICLHRAYLPMPPLLFKDINNIIIMHSLVHYQLSSPRLKNLFNYAWFAAGYTDEQPVKVENPKKFCFNSNFVTCDICCNRTIITHGVKSRSVFNIFSMNTITVKHIINELLITYKHNDLNIFLDYSFM